MVSHDIKTAVVYAKQVLHLAGEQVFLGDPEAYGKSPVGRRFLSSGA
jgi:ABC-type Mn2+/Zn2+ transport system ATPase subunit